MNTYKMHTNEAYIDKALVKRLIELQFPHWADLAIEEVKSAGTDNAIFRLGTDMVVRLPRIEGAAAHVNKEYQWLPLLASHMPLAIPMPVAKAERAEGYPWQWSIYQWLDGDTVTIDQITDLRQTAIDLGKFITALQASNTDQAPISSRGLPLISRDEETRAAINCLEPNYDKAVITKIWNSAVAEAPWQGSPVWIHGDLHESNLLFQQGKLTAVIDFGIAGIGDPACDMMAAWTLFSKKTRTIFRQTVQTDDATWQRGRGWALSFGVVALPYYEKSNPILAQSARRAIDEVIADYESNCQG